ncbi:ThiF family adenylyltransferase [Aerolutibacter ruishenii]|uniref:JAB domain-containing protein similar to deubiquitination enzymes n=1 Tax=Aerolutibacter ruishenii TaxID=686800 RepID=A0A562LFI9_9GAMM|nr:ThiF family adenylyltransferase [Lysobacter ruishenii]TWI06373.1 JAB domain-containing protein similar to deubiquitination enzymes [Lysobacter ruishenii]
MYVTLNMTAAQHAELRGHLYPGDGNEAVALLLCGHRIGDENTRLVVREVHPVPYARCRRTATRVDWNPAAESDALDRAEREGLVVWKVRSHPNAMRGFSAQDDVSDRELLPIFSAWGEQVSAPSGSAIMLPDGSLLGRYLQGSGEFVELDAVQVVGHDLKRWARTSGTSPSQASHVMAFGEGTFAAISTLSIAVVGCSGTGSPLIEQLARMAPRELILIDPDVVEERNLNRIVHATKDDAEKERPKVEVLKRAIEAMGLGTRVRILKASLWSRQAIRLCGEADVVFGCVDSPDGRYLLNAISIYYTIPYVDLGICVDAIPTSPTTSKVRAACGSVHYLVPGGSSLLSRGLISMADVTAARRAVTDPEGLEREVKEGYVRGVPTSRPAVISINSALASLAVTELIARIAPFRDEPNSNFDQVEVDFAGMTIFQHAHPRSCRSLGAHVGLGDAEPMLGIYMGLEE